MSSAKERLGRLLTLAAEARWAPLARELADIVLDWPPDFSFSMREPLTALLDQFLRGADRATRAELARRIGGHPELPLHLLNELYLVAPAPVRREILLRNELEPDDAEAARIAAADATALLAIARQPAGRDFASALEAAFGIPHHTAREILDDTSGEPLAVLCRGAGIDRAIYSAVVLLKGPSAIPLSIFDTVPQHAAERLVRHWRARARPSETEAIKAAE